MIPTNRLLRFVRREWPLLTVSAVFLLQVHFFNYLTDLSQTFFIRRSLFNIGLAALLFGPSLLIVRKSARYLYLAAVSLLLAAVFCAQYLFFSYSGSFLQASAIRYLGYGLEVADSLKTLPLLPLVLFVLPLLLLLVLYRLDDAHRPRYSGRAHLVILVSLVMVFTAGLGFIAALDYRQHGHLKRVFNNPYDNSNLIKKVGLIGYGGFDLRKYLATPKGISAHERRFVEEWASSNPAPAFGSGEGFRAAAGRNLIFIQIESFERFLLGLKVSGQEVTPNLNRLVKDSLYFSNYFYTIGPGHTVDSEFVSLNSLLPLQDRVLFFEYPTHTYRTLAHQLRDEGYRADVFHAHNGSFWNRASAYTAQGYNRFYDKRSFNLTEEIGWGLSDEQFYLQTAAMLKDKKLQDPAQPLFAFLVTLTLHTPFDLPEEYRELNIPEEAGLNWIQERYLQLARYTDRALGVFIDQLKADGLYEDSIIAITGDHAAFIAQEDDDNFAQLLGAPDRFSRLSHFYSQQVPFLIHLPNSSLKGDIATPAGALDIYPTLANLLGLSPPKSALGQDLLNTKEPLGISLRFNTKLIDALMGDNLLYFASETGDFDSGDCLRLPDSRPQAIHHCRGIYDRAQDLLKVSEIVIRGNAIDLLDRR